jgi:predicted DNA-binding protein (UPF0251 family)
MPRPRKNRVVNHPPLFNQFKPIGIAGRHLEEVLLSLDEYEALRLADYKGLSHEEAAEEMDISRSTFTRLIEQSRAKITEFLVSGKMLRINGGNIHFRQNIIKCHDCGYMFKTDFDTHMDKCPECNSQNLENLAGGFGHGRCCRNNWKEDNNAKRRQNRTQS